MKRILILAAVAALTAGVIGTASADDDQSERRDVKASLSGFAEVPSISTTGAGKLRLRIDPETSTITYELNYSGLQGGAVTGAHLHFAQVGVAAPGNVIASLCGGTEAACPATPAGVLAGTIVPAEILGPAAQGIAPGEFAEVVRAIRAGAVYANVHTATYPTGEIRGQLKGGKW